MEIIPASTLSGVHPSSKASLGEVGSAATEPGASTATPSFEELLQLLVFGEPAEVSRAVNQQTLPQHGQALAGTFGNSSPLLLPLAFTQDVIPTAPVTAEIPLPRSVKADSAAAGTLLPLGGSLLATKSLLGGDQLFRAGADGRGADGGTGMSMLAAARDDANLQLPSSVARTPEGAGESALCTPAPHTTSVEAALPTDPQRFIVSPRLDAPHWEGAFAGRVVWMAKEQHQFVELRLNPPELGWVNVRMALHQNDATLAIGVHSATVREAVEATLPRLRELLAESGVSLINVDVSSSEGFSSDGRGSAGGYDGYQSLVGISSNQGHEAFRETGVAKLQTIFRGIVDRYA